MSPARLALLASIVAAVPAGCGKKPQTTAPPVVVVEDDKQPDAAGGGTVEAEPATPSKGRKPPPGKPVHVRATMHGLGDVMALIKQATTSWTPKQPIDPAAQIQAILLQMGYGPGLWNNLDLAGPFAVDATFHAQDPGADLKLVGSLAAVSAKGVMDGMPSTQRPQPLGSGLWELIQGDLRIFLREKPKALEFALTSPDLDRAPALVDEAGKGRRVALRAWDLPPGLGGNLNLGLPPALQRQVDAVLKDTKSASLEVDAGTDRDLVLQASAEAPFSKLGLTPLGPARTQSPPLEASLPAGPVLVVSLPWGSPEALHKSIDKGVRLDQIPAPFDKVARDALGGVHGLLDQIAGDVTFAVYMSPKGEVSALLAANVKDEAAARAAARGVLQSAATGLDEFNKITGDDKSAKVGVTFKTDGVKAGAAKGDLLALAVPKNMQKEMADLEPVLTKGKLELVTVVSGTVAALAVGAGAQKLAADVGAGLKAPRKTSLATDTGLRLARTASQGCHFCVGFDPIGMIRLAALLDVDDRADKPRMKQLDAAGATFTRLGGAVGVGVKLDANLGSLAVGLPKGILVLSPADAATIGVVWADDADDKKAADKPLSGKKSI
jgi:hypothetical protein